jgi:hypothetical protein
MMIMRAVGRFLPHRGPGLLFVAAEVAVQCLAEQEGSSGPPPGACLHVAVVARHTEIGMRCSIHYLPWSLHFLRWSSFVGRAAVR